MLYIIKKQFDLKKYLSKPVTCTNSTLHYSKVLDTCRYECNTSILRTRRRNNISYKSSSFFFSFFFLNPNPFNSTLYYSKFLETCRCDCNTSILSNRRRNNNEKVQKKTKNDCSTCGFKAEIAAFRCNVETKKMKIMTNDGFGGNVERHWSRTSMWDTRQKSRFINFSPGWEDGDDKRWGLLCTYLVFWGKSRRQFLNINIDLKYRNYGNWRLAFEGKHCSM